MATTTHTLRGTVKWAKVFKPDEKYNLYSVNLYPDPDSFTEFKGIGLKNGVKSDEDGDYIVFRRPHVKNIKGEAVTFGPPVVEDMQGNNFDQLIGNGSRVEIEVVVYDYNNNYGQGKGSRLEKVRVVDLVEYNKPDATQAPKRPF